MSVPIQVTFRGIDPSDSLSELIEKESAKLDAIFDRIVRCHVIVEKLERHLHNGAPFRVSIDLTVPGAEIAVDTERHRSAESDALHKDPTLAIRDAFRRARRRLQERIRRRRGT
jgi:ribosome-associated translation inhibitor RaiA